MTAVMQDHPITTRGTMSTEHTAGAVVLASLVILFLIRRGFRGVRVPGVGSVNL